MQTDESVQRTYEREAEQQNQIEPLGGVLSITQMYEIGQNVRGVGEKATQQASRSRRIQRWRISLTRMNVPMDHGMKARNRFHHRNRNEELSVNTTRTSVSPIEKREKNRSTHVDRTAKTRFTNSSGMAYSFLVKANAAAPVTSNTSGMAATSHGELHGVVSANADSLVGAEVFSGDSVRNVPRQNSRHVFL